ncbi:uncharacterized protein LOC142341879 isoform X2 [Convolutriloba macropyga]|uniref:uncharacterized protein LOC142341879 isoform X2 n=1 Tax=Convolutriloba macropyga TaxID=536237 RepID=UPI003F520D90
MAVCYPRGLKDAHSNCRLGIFQIEMDNQQLEEELGILRSIFGDEVSISEQTQDGIRSQVSMQLFPSTADDESKKHVCVTVVFTISPTYPKEKPVVELDSVRGLNQQLEKELMVKLDELLESRLEGAMLFDAIDLIKEFLTCHNHPSVECAICLETMSSDYHEFSSFVKTDCFHYFHPWCLSEYLKSTQVIVQDENTDPNETPGGGCVGHVCPICRTELSLTVEYLDSFERPTDAESDRTPDAQPIELGEEFRKFQQQMQQLLEKQKEQGGTVDASTTSNVVIDVSAASRKSPQNSSSSSDQPSSSTIDGHSTDDTGGNLTSKGDPVAPKLEETQNRLSNQANLDMKPGSFVSRRGYTKNLNSSYPLNSTFRRTNSKEVSNDFRPRNLSASYSAGSGTNEQAARIDHKYHDGRWRPRKKHDFEIRAELLEKSRSLDDQNSAIDLSEEQEISAAVENKVKTSNSSEGVPNERTSNVPNQSSASKQSSKDSVNETEVRHSNLHHTVSNPVPDVTTPAYNPPRTDPMTQPPTRRIKKKPPLSLPSKANFPGNHNYAEGEYYSQYGYDYRGSEHWYYGGGVNNAANSNESFYSANNPEIYSRNRHSYHGNNKRGKTGYQGRKGHSSGAL